MKIPAIKPIHGWRTLLDLEAIGLNFLDSGNLDQARPFFLQALPLRRKFEGPLSPSVSDNYNSLGSIAYARHELGEAERYFRGNLTRSHCSTRPSPLVAGNGATSMPT